MKRFLFSHNGDEYIRKIGKVTYGAETPKPGAAYNIRFSVKRLYTEWLSLSMCPDSEKYLHAVYVDRSSGIKKFKELQ